MSDKFKVGEFYKHTSSMDVVVEVVKVLDANSRWTRMIVRYWNLGYTGRPWLIDEATSIIRVDSFVEDNWKQLDIWELVEPRTKER